MLVRRAATAVFGICGVAAIAPRHLQPRPTAPRGRYAAAVDALPLDAQLPKLIVFDLDHTIWTPELYTLRRLPNYASAGPPGPVAGEDVWLLDGAEAALSELASHPRWSGALLGVASRTNKGAWARSLLASFAVPDAEKRPRTLDSLLAFKQIFAGDKKAHFEALRRETGVPYSEMLFFDDARDGRFGNCAPVAALGVMASHCPRGLTEQVWADSLRAFCDAKLAGEPVGRVLDAATATATPARSATATTARSATATSLRAAVVVRYSAQKGFGFVRWCDSAEETFFHSSAARPATDLSPGSAVSVALGEFKGRTQCSSVEPRVSDGDDVSARNARDSSRRTATTAATTVRMPCFSMNLPFAALLAHGTKTLETRNHTMFAGTSGRRVALHVGQRTYPDGGKHRELLAAAGLGEAEIARVTSLPKGFARGQVVAVVTLGATRLVADELERSAPEIQNAVCATGDAMGRYLTEIQSVDWLPAGIPLRGRPGLFDVDIPADSLPPAPAQPLAADKPKAAASRRVASFED